MASFWENNKKKSKWALLLLLLRWRKGTIPLLLLVVVITGAFSAPAGLLAAFVHGLAGLPLGGRQAAAGITWMASNLGIGGLDNGRHSFAELMAAFRAAKDARNAGVGTFFRPLAGGAGAGYGDSVGMVRGNLNDAGAGANLASKIKGGDSINGILTPKDAKEAGGGVVLGPEDLTGERASLVQSAYGEGTAKGRGNRLKAGLSEGGGAYAGKWFFSAGGHAVNPDNLRSTLSGASVPRATAADTATRRPVGWKAPSTTASRAAAAARNYGGKCAKGSKCALGQLVTSRNAGMMSSGNICSGSNGCPGEYASATSGATYDGVSVGDGSPIVSAPAEVDGFSTPNIPDPSTNLDDGFGATPDPEQLNQCMQSLGECERQKDVYRTDMEIQQRRLDALSDQLPGACDDPCDCGGCNNLLAQILAICQGPVTTDFQAMTAPCVLPDYCSQYGESLPNPNVGYAAQQAPTCNNDGMECGCGDWMCDVSCWF